jgi:phosphoribosyl-AMP cyclohydrolase
VPSESLNKALISPLARQAPAGFCFLQATFLEATNVEIAFGKGGGLVPAIVQDDGSGEVLMLGFMNEEALGETRRTREVVFFSRSRNRLWKKGESSGHVLKVREVRVDCDADALLVRVEPVGPGVCHEGYRSCFFRRVEEVGDAKVVEERTFAPEQVYGQERKR